MREIKNEIVRKSGRKNVKEKERGTKRKRGWQDRRDRELILTKIIKRKKNRRKERK